MTIVVERVSKTFKGRAGEVTTTLVLDDINFEIGSDEIVTVIGPSGSGKSTLLNCIAGLETYDGSIRLDGTDIRQPHPDIAVVFQSPHLLPWRTTLANVEYGLEIAGRPKDERREIAREMLAVVGLGDAAERYPSQLSGGMQQRVNIARALALSPQVLLMDEPFGALDAITKERLQEELQGIVADRHVGVLFITHDISEAIYLGDRVLTLSTRPGRIRLTRTVSEARPRSLDFKQSPEFLELYSELRHSLI
jgi:NitT/TauT family transport system ATP-binding protein